MKVGFFFLCIGIFVFLFTPLKKIRDEIFTEMRLAIYKQKINDNNTMLHDITIEHITNDPINHQQEISDYAYIGELNIPSIGLKRGFVSKESKYNDINYNIQIAKEADYPDVKNGNFILMAHSGDAVISYFDSLYRLELGDIATVSYEAKAYYYQLVKTYDVEKTGKIAIYRDYQKKTLTLITCTHNDAKKQSVYIFEQTKE